VERIWGSALFERAASALGVAQKENAHRTQNACVTEDAKYHLMFVIFYGIIHCRAKIKAKGGMVRKC
jgi:hypothetical protein